MFHALSVFLAFFVATGTSRRLGGAHQVERLALTNTSIATNGTCQCTATRRLGDGEMCNWDAVKHYFCNGGDIDLDDTGHTDLLTQRWKNQKLDDIEEYICGGGGAPKTWNIGHDVTDWRCDWWIGGFALKLTNVQDLGICPSCCNQNYKITLTMSDKFEDPGNVVNFSEDDVPAWLVWCLNLDPGFPFTVSHTWTEYISCDRSCEPSASPTKAPTPPTADPSSTESPISGMPISGMPISEMPISGMPVSEMPVSGMPVSEMPVWEISASPIPNSEMPVSEMPASGMPVY